MASLSIEVIMTVGINKPLTKYSKEQLREKLLSIGGTVALIPSIEEDLPQILERGVSPSIKHLYVMKGRDSQCHENSALCWDANRGYSSIMTGYALSKGQWVQHSWVLDSRETIVETTFKREAYFGFELTPEEADQFYFDNVW